MSAAMLRQMMEEASVFMKEEKYRQALDSARRVSQFDANNFQALMCVGLANLHLKQWKDSETALRRAADLKPDLPAPWKNLVDLFEATGDLRKKIEMMKKLINVFRKGNKVKPSQKWIAEIAANAMTLKLYATAFDAWYSLVEENQELSVDVTPNEELPSSLVIWLQLTELLQSPNFTLSESRSKSSMVVLLKQFVAVAQRWNWTDTAAETEALRSKTDSALAMFLRFQLNHVKSAKSLPAKRTELKTLDSLTSSIIEWFPTARLPAEYLLLRSEDEDSPLSTEQNDALASRCTEAYPKSAISLMFQGLATVAANPTTARDLLMEGLASSSSSSFHESAMCVRAHMELAGIALDARDVEGCLSRLRKAQHVVQDKAATLGTQPPKNAVYSELKLQLMLARAHDLAGAVDMALAAYQKVLQSDGSTSDAIATAAVGGAELLISKNRIDEALELLDSADQRGLEPTTLPSLVSIRAWIDYLRGAIPSALLVLTANASKVPGTSDRARALKRLGVVSWHADDGKLRADKAKCLNSFLLSAKLAPRDGGVFAWIGRWYLEVANDVQRGEKCFLKALELAPANEMAGLALSALYDQQTKPDLNVALWERLTATPEKAPTWALLRLAQHRVDQNDESAVTKLHVVLRNEPLNATYWLAMGHIYRHFGKLVAAQRSYLRAIELGESGWCVLTELARIEGSLHLYEDALTRIEKASQVVGDDDDAAKAVVGTLYAELLFDYAKYLNGEGLYGRAASNIKKAASLIQDVLVASSTATCVHVLKLIGDLHSFAFYLSPVNFTDGGADGSGWLEFLTQGRKAYGQIHGLTDADDSDAMAQAHYDVGVSCWYIARATYSTHGAKFNAFATLSGGEDKNQDAVTSLEDARRHLCLALSHDPSLGLAWNALGVVMEHPLAKQFAWVRAIQTSNTDAAWANLGMLYVHFHGLSTEATTSRSATLARNALLHLQAVNPNNPAMWIGYGMLYLAQASVQDKRKAQESFQCALEVGYHVDALLGFVVSSLAVQQTEEEKTEPTDETMHFAIKKYLEREPFDGKAWSLLSVIQLRLGLTDAALASVATSVKTSQHEDVLTNYSIVKAVVANPSSEDTDRLLATLVATNEIGFKVAQAQQWFQSGDVSTSLRSVQELLASESISSTQRGLVARIALATSALAVTCEAVLAKQVADAARAVITDRIATSEASREEEHAIEMFHRVAGSTQTLVDEFNASVSSSVRVALAMVDVVDPRSFDASPSVATGDVDALVLAALQSLLTSNESVSSSPMKLVRCQPWNPIAYVLAGLSIYRRSVTSQSTDILPSARRLLSTAEKLARSPLAELLVHWATSLVLDRSGGDEAPIREHTTRALAALRGLESALAPYDRLLWEARILSLSDPSAAMAKFTAALASLKTSGSVSTQRVLTTLHELGSAFESLGHLDAAQQVWKAIMVWKTPVSARPDTDSSTAGLNTTGFIGNLRLALLQASRNNTKAAKKHAKTAVTLASRAVGDGADSSMASTLTAARFVEGVVVDIKE